MNENPKEKKIDVKKILINMAQFHKNLNYYSYNFLNLFSINQDNYKENYMDYKFHFKPIVMLGNNQLQERKNSFPSSKNNNTKENYSERAKYYFNNIYKFICCMTSELSKLNLIINKPSIILENVSHNKDQESSNWGSRAISKVNLISLLFYNMIIYNEDDILREYLKNKVKMVPRYYFLSLLPNTNKKNSNQSIKHISKLPQVVEDEIKKVLKKNFTKINSFYFHIDKDKINLNIEYFPFKVMLEIPNILKDVTDFKKYKVYVFGLYENQNNCYKDTSSYILFEKIRSLFEIKLKFIHLNIYKKYARDNSVNKGEFILLFTLIGFIKYIYDYDEIFNTKCIICNKCIKYSLTEKCFFPPYYKILDYEKEKNQLMSKQKINNNNNICEKYNNYHFVHEECVMRLAVPAL